MCFPSLCVYLCVCVHVQGHVLHVFLLINLLVSDVQITPTSLHFLPKISLVYSPLRIQQLCHSANTHTHTHCTSFNRRKAICTRVPPLHRDISPPFLSPETTSHISFSSLPNRINPRRPSVGPVSLSMDDSLAAVAGSCTKCLQDRSFHGEM